MKICDVDVDDMVISKLNKAKNNCKYLIGYLDEVIKPLVLVLLKMRYVKTSKEKNNKLVLFQINDDKQLEKYKTIWTEI